MFHPFIIFLFNFFIILSVATFVHSVEPLFVAVCLRFALSSRSFCSKCKFSRWRAALRGGREVFGSVEPLFSVSGEVFTLASRSFSRPRGFWSRRAALRRLREVSDPAEPLSALHIIIYTRARGLPGACRRMGQSSTSSTGQWSLPMMSVRMLASRTLGSRRLEVRK